VVLIQMSYYYPRDLSSKNGNGFDKPTLPELLQPVAPRVGRRLPVVRKIKGRRQHWLTRPRRMGTPDRERLRTLRAFDKSAEVLVKNTDFGSARRAGDLGHPEYLLRDAAHRRLGDGNRQARPIIH
jgi:hypothetical protein